MAQAQMQKMGTWAYYGHLFPSPLGGQVHNLKLLLQSIYSDERIS